MIRTLPRTFVAAAAAFVCSLPAGAQELGHDTIARAYAERHGLELTPGGAEVVVAAMDKAFARIPVGAFDVRVPVGVPYDRHELADLQTALVVLAETQEAWMVWYSGDPKAKFGKAVAPLRKAYVDFVDDLTIKLLADPSAAGDVLLSRVADEEQRAQIALYDLELQRAVGLQPAVVEAGVEEESVSEGMQEGEPFEGIGDVMAPDRNFTPQVFVLCPSRAEFVDFACYVGFVREQLQGIYWQQSLALWNEFDFDGVRVIPLRYIDHQQDDYRVGVSMKGRSGDGLQHHVMQLGTRALLEALYENRIDPMLAAGLSSAMVIEQYKRIDTRTDGDLKSNSKSGRSVFIPASLGGQSQGGSLPPAQAGSRWTKELGNGYFLKNLKSALKNGGKLVKNRDQKRRTFEILHEDEVQKYPMVAPFFHSAGVDRVVPTGYAPDFADFLRAYRTAFAHYIVADADGKKSAERFAQFLQLLREDSNLAAAAAIEQVYGVPFSSAEPGKDDLEGRFIADIR